MCNKIDANISKAVRKYHYNAMMANAASAERKYLLNLDEPTCKGEYYIDNNHHPGPQTILHRNAFLQMIC